MILIIDNFDSFTYLLADLMRKVIPSEQVVVYRNGELSVSEIASMAPRALVISPGPYSPEECDYSCHIIREFMGRIPILGVCLGHQCLAYVEGLNVKKAPEPKHGRQSALTINSESSLFPQNAQGQLVGRYHSLAVERDFSHSEIIATAYAADDGVVMALENRKMNWVGVQFHPESILTQSGELLVSYCLNFLGLSSHGR